ncbi:alpha/beta fold hydrolase [Streptomyces iconiensis]|uniref:Alpha/beta hydrolase n=1 Tax=Streptomyces iconiensis TaxID=1384038 RepID=A0ABT6ZVK8_9ACTN|nr:alpha/beta hydrolase [Streptomyces iconiensis]MDJ1133098.1 alpha/beta hydrolase [Streptomyces iconiensis]
MRSHSVRHGYLVGPGGGRLHYLDHCSDHDGTSSTGSTDGTGGTGGPRETLVCLHGVTDSAWVWHDVAAALTGRCRVIALDLRGHGDSQWSAAHEYGTAEHAADLAALLGHLGGGPFHLAGSSWGALIALSHAAALPEQVRSLTLVDIEPSSGRSETDVPPRPASFVRHSAVAAWERAYAPHAPALLTELIAAQSVRPGPRGLLYRKHNPYFLSRWPFRSDDHWAELDAVTCPALVVQAGKTSVRPSVTRRMAARLRHGAHTEIPESNHTVPTDAPDALAGALRAFLA